MEDIASCKLLIVTVSRCYHLFIN